MSKYNKAYYEANKQRLMANNKKYRQTPAGKAGIKRSKAKAKDKSEAPPETFVDNMSLADIRKMLEIEEHNEQCI